MAPSGEHDKAFELSPLLNPFLALLAATLCTEIYCHCKLASKQHNWIITTLSFLFGWLFFVALHSDFLWHWLHSVWFLFSCCKIKLFQFQLLISIRSKVNYDFIFKLCKIPKCDFGIWHLKKQIENIGLSRLNWLHFLGIFWMVHNKATMRPLCMWMSHFLIQPSTAQAKCKWHLLPWANGKCFVLKRISNESICPYPQSHAQLYTKIWVKLSNESFEKV